MTEREQEIYDFLVTYTVENGFPPSIKDIMKYSGHKSTSTVAGYLDSLEKKGKIKRMGKSPRAIWIEDITIKRGREYGTS